MQRTTPRRWKLKSTLPGSAGLAPPFVIAALTSLAERLTLSVRHSTTKLRRGGVGGGERARG